MTAQLREGPWTALPSTTRRLRQIRAACNHALESSASVIGLLRLDVNVARLGWLIGLLILVASLWHPAAELLERLLVW
jgi:hypothetical protein